MGKTYSKLFMILAVACLVFLGATHVAKADNFTATPLAASGGNLGGASVTVDVWYYDGSTSSNPFGITIPGCGGCNQSPFLSDPLINGSHGVVDTAIFDTSTPGFELEGGTKNGVDVVALPGCGLTVYIPCGAINTSGSNSLLTVASGAFDFYTAGAIFTASNCNGTGVPDPFGGTCNGSATPVRLAYLTGTTVNGVAVTAPGVFSATDTSISYVFQIVGSSTPPPTPEASSLLMLGSGLLGLFGLGLRRRIEA